MDVSLAAARRARWAVAAIFFANGFVVGSWAAQIPLVKERLAIGHSTLGFALLAMAAGALVAMPLGGAVISRLGSAAVTRWSAVFCFATFPVAILAPSPLLLGCALFLFGAANGVMDVAMNAHGVAVEHRLNKSVMSGFHGMFSLGGLVGAGLAALLLPVMAPVLNAGLMAAVAMALAGAAFLYLLPGAADSGGGGSAFALPNRATLGLGLLTYLALTSEGAVLDWSGLHLRERLDVGTGMAAMGFAAFSATMAGGRFAGDWLRGHVGAVALVRASAFLSALGLALALLAPMPVIAVAGFAVVGLGMSNLVPIFFGAAGRIPGQSAGTGIAAIATMGYAGFLSGPPLIGLVAEATNLTLALGLIVIACVLVGIGAKAVAPARSRPVPAAAG
ncbi:MAG TPA: MFS transporter [Propylenella sp.]|nr:MFS transporter [Propylenella sp.]